MPAAATKSGEGESTTFIAPTGGVVIHVPILIGNVVVIPMETKAQTLPFIGAVVGEWEVDGLITDPVVVGDLMSFKIADQTFRRSLTYTEITGDLNGCAIAMSAKPNGVTRVQVRLCPGVGNVV